MNQTANLVTEYEKQGFTIARKAIDEELAGEMVEHIRWLTGQHPDTPPERLGHNLLVDDPFMWRLAGDDRLLDIAAQFIGNDIALFAAHYIAKPPATGMPVRWHQDGSYWPLEPMEVTTLWVSATVSSPENGCMRVIPGSQNAKLLSKTEMKELDRDEYVLGYGLDPADIDDSEAVDIELAPGDVSIHNPQIIHGSEANTSDLWRIGLTLRYIPTTTRVSRDGHRSMLLRGTAAPGVENAYAERPRFEEHHMRFGGCDEWNRGA